MATGASRAVVLKESFQLPASGFQLRLRDPFWRFDKCRTVIVRRESSKIQAGSWKLETGSYKEMSRLFDVLQRGRRRDPAEHAHAYRTAQADAVLATLGYRKRRPNSYAKPLTGVVLGTAVAIFIAWFLWPQTGPKKPVPDTASIRKPEPAPVGDPLPATPPPLPVPPPVAPSSALPSGQTLPKPVAGPVVTPPSMPPARSPRRVSPTVAAPSPQTKASPAPAAEGRAEQSAEIFRQAVFYHRSGDYENARARYLALLERNELDPRVHNNLGLLYRDRGMLDFAVREFRRALIVNSQYLTARNNLGVALLGQGKLDEAAAEFNRVLAQDPRNVDAIVNLALVDKAAGRPERAKELLLRALVLDARNAPAHFNLAALYEQSGDEARAVDHYRAFLENAGEDHAARTADARARIEALQRDRGSR
jgi:Tfp pilus assembly protein PilF